MSALIKARYGEQIYKFLNYMNSTIDADGSRISSPPAIENLLSPGGIGGGNCIDAVYYHPGHHEVAKDKMYRYGAVALYQMGTIKKYGANDGRLCADFDKSNYDVSTGNMYKYVKTKSTKLIKNKRKAFDKRGITY